MPQGADRVYHCARIMINCTRFIRGPAAGNRTALAGEYCVPTTVAIVDLEVTYIAPLLCESLEIISVLINEALVHQQESVQTLSLHPIELSRVVSSEKCLPLAVETAKFFVPAPDKRMINQLPSQIPRYSILRST